MHDIAVANALLIDAHMPIQHVATQTLTFRLSDISLLFTDLTYLGENY